PGSGEAFRWSEARAWRSVDAALRARREDHADGVGTGPLGHDRVLRAGDAADLDAHLGVGRFGHGAAGAHAPAALASAGTTSMAAPKASASRSERSCAI